MLFAHGEADGQADGQAQDDGAHAERGEASRLYHAFHHLVWAGSKGEVVGKRGRNDRAQDKHRGVAVALAREKQLPARAAAGQGKGPKSREGKAARAAYQGFLLRLNHFRVLDPACGSGNFLYLALKALRDIEKRARVEAQELGLPPPLGLLRERS